ncbi:MAG: acyl-CoA desaturase [Crocinitomicaceae bacterium]|nr:acyl-CoA desaturase [Crocinitomicaceae bacterium]
MKKILFRGDDPSELEFSRVLKKRVHNYFKENNIGLQGNIRMYVKTFILMGLYIVPFVLLLTLSMNTWMNLGLIMLMGVGAAGVGMSIMHDAAHGAYSSKSVVNKILSSSIFLLGSNKFNWHIQHNINHHTFTNIYERDPDISTKAVIRLCVHAPIKKYHKFQQYYAFLLYGLMTLARLFDDIPVLLKHNKEGMTKMLNHNPKKEFLKLIAIKILYFSTFIALPLWLTNFTIWEVLIGFTIMHLTAGIIMSTVFQMAHVVEGSSQSLPDKENTIRENWVIHQFRSTADFGRKKSFLSWYIGGLDFQIEHHLFPYICHVHYSAIAPLVKQTAEEYGFKYNSKLNFPSALKSHFISLKKLGSNTQ